MIALPMMDLLMYMVAMFLVGVGGIFGLIWWLWGPTARTIGIAHMFGNRIVQYPTDEGTWDFQRIKETDEKGRWQYETDDGRLRKLKVKRGDAKIEGGKCPMAIFPPNVSVSTNPKEAYVADEWKKNGYSEDRNIETWNESINFGSIKDSMKSVLSPSSLAGMMAQGIEMNKPLKAPESEGIDMGTTFKWGMPLIIAIVAIFVVFKMGII